MKVLKLPLYSFILKKYNSMFDDLSKEYKITQAEIDILAFLYNNPEYKYAQQLVDVRGISKAQVSIAIEKLVKKGLLIRKADSQNRRCNILLLTNKSDEIISKIRKIQNQFNGISKKEISEEEMEIFNKVLVQIYINLGGKMNE
jgi:Transcriptional regulators